VDSEIKRGKSARNGAFLQGWLGLSKNVIFASKDNAVMQLSLLVDREKSSYQSSLQNCS